MTVALRRLLLIAVLALLSLGAGARPELFELTTSGLRAGELWRLFTGHLVHGSAGHYAYDVGALALVVLAFGVRLELLWLPPLLGMAIVAVPGVEHYHGLSALLHGLVVVHATRLIVKRDGAGRGVALAVLAGTLAKSFLEAVAQEPVMTAGVDMGGPVLYLSHFIGAVVGAGYAALTLTRGAPVAPASAIRDSPTQKRREIDHTYRAACGDLSSVGQVLIDRSPQRKTGGPVRTGRAHGARPSRSSRRSRPNGTPARIPGG